MKIQSGKGVVQPAWVLLEEGACIFVLTVVPQNFPWAKCLTTILVDPSFLQEELGAQRGYVSCPRLHSSTELELESKQAL